MANAGKLVSSIKSRVIQATESHLLEELQSLKKKKLTDEACKAMPETPGDLFKHKRHFVMNVFQNKVDGRIDLLALTKT